MTMENVTPIRQDGQQPAKTVTLPATRAALTWDRATDALVAAAEDAEAKAKTKYDQAKAEYQSARQNAHLIRQLRQLARVDGSTVSEQAATPPSKTEGKRWSRDHDACVNPGHNGSDIKHLAGGRCAPCHGYWLRHGSERPIQEAQTNGD